MNKQNDTKTNILDATINLLLANKDQSNYAPGFREIARQAKVSLGLINYHFTSRDNLIRQAVRWYIGKSVIADFDPLKNKKQEKVSSIELLTAVILGPLDYIMSMPQLSRISILTDLTSPSADDNTAETWQGLFTTLIHILGKDLDRSMRLALWAVIASIHEAFLRPEHFVKNSGLDLTKSEDRRVFAEELASWLLV